MMSLSKPQLSLNFLGKLGRKDAENTQAMTKPKIGIALGSGGARGWCHIGALRVLAEEGVEPDIVAGCSMGALVGAAYIAGKLDALEQWARALTWRKAAGFVDVSLSSGGLIEGKRVVSFLRTLQDDAPIESFGKPFTAIASDLATGREIWLQKGPILSAVRASIALPGIFSPINLDGRWLLDGGMTNPVPVSACRAMGADVIIAINPNANVLDPHSRRTVSQGADGADALGPDLVDKMFESLPAGIRQGLKSITPRFLGSKSGSPGYVDVLSASIDIMTSQILRSRLAGEPPHVMMRPRLAHLSVLEFHRAVEAIEEGRDSAMKAMPVLRDYLA
jgi:NTE family protein